MKKIVFLILAAAMIFASAATVSAEEKEMTDMVITVNPVARTFPEGGTLTYTVKAENCTSYRWFLRVNDVDYDLTDESARSYVKKFGIWKGEEIMEISGYDTDTLVLDHVYNIGDGTNYVFCELSDGTDKIVTDGVKVVTKQNAPVPPEISMPANVLSRVGNVIKLAVSVTDPEGFSYDDFSYKWTVSTENTLEVLPDDGPVVICDGSLPEAEYTCEVTAHYGSKETTHETLRTIVLIYKPVVSVSYDCDPEISAVEGESFSIKATPTVIRPQDTGKITYKWYKCDDGTGAGEALLEGANSDTLTLTATASSGKAFYYCEVINEPYYRNNGTELEGTSYSSNANGKSVVTVVFSARVEETPAPTAEPVATPSPEAPTEAPAYTDAPAATDEPQPTKEPDADLAGKGFKPIYIVLIAVIAAAAAGIAVLIILLNKKETPWIS